MQFSGPPFSPRAMLMSSNVGAVYGVKIIVRFDFDRFDRLKVARSRPVTEATIDGLPGAITFREVSPGRA